LACIYGIRNVQQILLLSFFELNQSGIIILEHKPSRVDVKGTFILKRYGVYYKVISVRHTEDFYWILNCIDLDTKQKKVLRYQLLGMLEALETAAKKLKHQKDIMLIDLDDNGAVKFMTKQQINKL